MKVVFDTNVYVAESLGGRHRDTVDCVLDASQVIGSAVFLIHTCFSGYEAVAADRVW